jgi:DNA-binding transcriptional LysR family regulator
MTIEQVLYFIEVCKSQSFTKAADHLHVTQTAVSHSMKMIEQEYNVCLFFRTANRIQLTPEAQILLRQAQKVAEQYDCFTDTAKDLMGERNFLRVGLSTLSGNGVFPAICSSFKKQHPEITLSLTEAATDVLFQELEEGRQDVIITSCLDADKPIPDEMTSRYDIYPCGDGTPCFCVSADSPLAGKAVITFAEIATVPLVLMSSKYQSANGILKEFSDRQIQPTILLRTDQFYTVERFVERGIAGGFLPAYIAKSNLSIACIPFEGSVPVRTDVFVKKGQYVVHAVEYFLDTVCALYPNG